VLASTLLCLLVKASVRRRKIPNITFNFHFIIGTSKFKIQVSIIKFGCQCLVEKLVGRLDPLSHYCYG
jgi:hypothetical protein